MATKKYVWFDSFNQRYVGNFTTDDLKELKKRRLQFFPFINIKSR